MQQDKDRLNEDTKRFEEYLEKNAFKTKHILNQLSTDKELKPFVYSGKSR